MPMTASTIAPPAKMLKSNMFRRRAETERSSTSSIVATPCTGWFGSIDCTSRRMAAVSACGSPPEARATSVMFSVMPSHHGLAMGVKISGRTACVKPVCLTSPTTPTIVIHVWPVRMRRPMGSSPSMYLSASVLLTMTKGAPSPRSFSSKKRPRRSGMPRARK
jgi:hypothetical protein